MGITKYIIKVPSKPDKVLDLADVKTGLASGAHTITVEAWNGAALISTQTKNITIAAVAGTPTTGVVANYEFNETTGGLIDSINAYNGLVNGTMGRNGTVYDFGVDTYVLIDDKDDFSFRGATDDVPYTIRLKISFDAFTNGWVISKRDGVLNDFEYQLYVYDSILNFMLSDGSGNNNLTVSIPTTGLVTGTYYHIVVTYDGSKTAAGLKMSINKSETGTSSVMAGSYVGAVNSPSKLILGRAEFTQGFYGNFKMDSLRFHKNYKWSAAEISNDFDAIMV